MLGMTIPTSIAVMAMGSGAAWAQTTYNVEGSDTLTEVILNAITKSGANIHYNNIGSGQAEKNMVHDTVFAAYNNYQGIGPMSRNFTGQVLDPDCAAKNPATCNPSANPPAPYMGHANWAPTPKEVVGLDAGIVALFDKNGQCQNIGAQADLVSPADQGTDKLNTLLSIVLSGYPESCEGVFSLENSTQCTVKSKATTKECASPTRLAALDWLSGSSCAGSRIDHIYRRDDKSGTQDTFREHLQFDRWCNGKSEGNNGARHSNLSNQDLDPIRRRCVASDYVPADSPTQTTTPTQGARALTKCTYYPLATQCMSGDADITDPTYGTIKCTQGLVVALSETDFGSKDITISIRNRVAAGNGTMAGLAGMAVVEQGNNTVGTTINTNSFENDNIRSGGYMFSRRLFLQRAPFQSPTPPAGCTYGQTPPEAACGCPTSGIPATQNSWPSCLRCPSGTVGTWPFCVVELYPRHSCEPWPMCQAVIVGGVQVMPHWVPDTDPFRNAEEVRLYAWLTNRVNAYQIVKDAGFLPPLDDPTMPCNDPLNIACVSAPYGLGTPKQNIGAETTACATGYPCVANGSACTTGTGNCGAIPSVPGTYACNVHDATHAGPKCTTGTCALDSALGNLAGKCQ
jgi:hypothetical protein